jgi:hypothetical protein
VIRQTVTVLDESGDRSFERSYTTIHDHVRDEVIAGVPCHVTSCGIVFPHVGLGAPSQWEHVRQAPTCARCDKAADRRTGGKRA